MVELLLRERFFGEGEVFGGACHGLGPLHAFEFDDDGAVRGAGAVYVGGIAATHEVLATVVRDEGEDAAGELVKTRPGR